MPLDEYQKEIKDLTTQMEAKSYTKGATDMVKLIKERLMGRNDSFFMKNEEANKALTEIMTLIEKDRIQRSVKVG